MKKTSFPKQKLIYSLIVLGVFLFFIGILNLKDRINWNDPSDGISWVEQDQGIIAYRIVGEHVPADIHPGDLLLKINQHEILNLGDYTDVLFMMHPGDNAHYVLKDNATGDVKTIVVHIFPRPIITIKDFFRVLVAFVYFFIGILILLKYPKARGSVHFYLVCLFSFTLYLYSYTNKLSTVDYVVYWISVVSLLLLPPLFLHFSLNFPTPKKWMKNSALATAYIYFPFVFLLAVQILWFTGRLANLGLPRNLSTRLFLDNIHIIYFTLYFFVAMIILFHSRVSLESPELKQQMKWIVSGTILSVVPFFFLYILPYILNLEITPLMQASILSLAFLPLSFAYAIMKYRLMDVDIIVKRGAAYFIASATVLGLYFLLIGLSGIIFKYFFPHSNTLAVATSALVVAFLFSPIRKKVQEHIDRFFYKEEYAYRQSLIEFGRSISTESSLKTITSTIIERVNKSLNIEEVAIFLRVNTDKDSYELVAHNGLKNAPKRGGHYKIPKEFLIEGHDVPTLTFRVFEGENSEWLYSLKEFYESQSLYYFQPLEHRNEIIGVLALGKGKKGKFLTSEDLSLLSMLSGYAAIALENARLYSSLQNKASELELLKAYSENIIEGINVGVVAINRSGKITTWNQAMSNLYGLTSKEVIGKTLKNVFPQDIYNSILVALNGKNIVVERTVNIYKLFIENVNGEKKFVNLTLSPFLESSGKVIGTLMVFDDITSKVQLENQLLQSEKMSSLGIIAAGVAHEVNTPLTGISSFTQMLAKEIPPENPHHNILQKIQKQCFRASEIVNNLLNFSRIQTTELTDVNVNTILEESINLLEHQFKKKNIRLRKELSNPIPLVGGNDGRLMQVFINILLNARDAVPRGGWVAVRTGFDETNIHVEIEDNGKGIPQDIIHKIYDPFFTTKGTRQGTGLGLSVSYGIIQEHGGRIYVDSIPEHGTCFHILLPLKRGEKMEVKLDEIK